MNLFVLIVFLLVFFGVGIVSALAKTGKTRAGMFIAGAVAVAIVLGLFLLTVTTHRRAVRVNGPPQVFQYAQPSEWTQSAEERAAVVRETERVWKEYVGTQPTPAAAPAPVWSEAMDDEFEADVYPSALAAVKSAGRRMAGSIRPLWSDPNGTLSVTLLQGTAGPELATAFAQTLEEASSGIRCLIEPSARDVNDIGIMLSVVKKMQVIRSQLDNSGGKIVAAASRGNGGVTVEVPFVEKPWVQDFARFAAKDPPGRYIVVRSNGTCTSENEARGEAMNDAAIQLVNLISRKAPATRSISVSTADIERGGFVADRFVQSFDGSAGKIWRQAILIDVSPTRLGWLTNRTVRLARPVYWPWVRQVGSAFGVLALILVTYFFLNLATRGYYRWALRIAGIVLAVVVIIVLLHWAGPRIDDMAGLHIRNGGL